MKSVALDPATNTLVLSTLVPDNHSTCLVCMQRDGDANGWCECSACKPNVAVFLLTRLRLYSTRERFSDKKGLTHCMRSTWAQSIRTASARSAPLFWRIGFCRFACTRLGSDSLVANSSYDSGTNQFVSVHRLLWDSASSRSPAPKSSILVSSCFEKTCCSSLTIECDPKFQSSWMADDSFNRINYSRQMTVFALLSCCEGQ